MGLEARCRALVVDATGATREGEGTALLESDELIVRGPARVRVPRASISDVGVDGDSLVVTHAAGRLSLALGPSAEKWRARLAEAPKALIDKLDVKPGAHVCVLDVDDAQFMASLRARTPNVHDAAGVMAFDVVFLGVDRPDHLGRIARAVEMLADRGALWVVHPKGRGGVTDIAIFAAGDAVGLVATKVARWSATQTAEKLVRRRA